MKQTRQLPGLKHLMGRRLFIILLVLGQIALFVFAIFRYSGVRWLTNGLTLISIVTALHLMARHDKSAIKLSLVFLILLFPLFGGAFYWILHFQTADVGFRKRFWRIEERSRHAARYREAHTREICQALPEGQQLIRYLSHAPGFPAYGKTKTLYFPTGSEMLSAMLSDIERARRYIFLEYFILEEGIMWDSVLELLRKKVREGVDVRMIYDDFGCFLTLPPGYDKKLESYGIKCQVFNKVLPFVTSSHNNRDHRKILVVDGEVAYTGGMNLADEYINEKIKYGHWKDNAIRLWGDGAWSFTVMFLHMWSLLTRQEEKLEDYRPTTESPNTDDGWVQPYSDSPIDRENVGEHVYSHIIAQAQNYLYITTPYLMVEDGMISALGLSAKSGVDVRIITPSCPDKKLVHFTTRSYYRQLIRAGVRIYEYADGFMHAKSFLADDTVATVGTTNLDFRSLYFHFECGTCLYRTSSIADLKQDYLDTLQRCREITEADCKTNLFIKLCQDVCRIFAPLM